MFRLIMRLILPILIVCTLLTAIMPLIIQRTVELSPEWDMFGFAACDLPCWAGITVGETPAADVSALMGTRVHLPIFLTDAGGTMTFWGQQDGYSLRGAFYHPLGGTITAFQLDFSNMPADMLIARFGLPDCAYVTLYDGFGMVWLQDGWSIDARIRGTLGEMFTAPESLHSLTVRMESSAPTCQIKRAIPYAGVAPWWRYPEEITEGIG